MVEMMQAKQDSKASTGIENKKTIRSEMKILNHVVLGKLRASHEAKVKLWTSQNLCKEDIQDKLTMLQLDDAMVAGMSREDLLQQISSLAKQSSGGKAGEAKSAYRNEFDNLTDNLLHSINNTSDVKIQRSLAALLDYDKLYQSLTSSQQSDRNDWRGLFMLKEHYTTPNQLVRHLGGWNDPSARDQYSNGRRVPVAKATGYTIEQELPVFTGEEIKSTKTKSKKNKSHKKQKS